MKVKDTVMSMKEINYIRNSTVCRDIANNAMNDGYRVGIKEVVDWIDKYSDSDFYIAIPQDEWQTKLKEWGFTPTHKGETG